MDTTERYDSASAQRLVERVRELHDGGHRLVQIGCLEVASAALGTKPPAEGAASGADHGANGSAPTSASADGTHEAAGKRLELIYSFDKGYELTHLRLTIARGEKVASISAIYDTAFLYENEIHDLFGVPIEGISLDFKGTFYQKEVARPFCSTDGTTPAAS